MEKMKSAGTLVFLLVGIAFVAATSYRKVPTPVPAASLLRDAYPSWDPVPVAEDVGETLILSSLIEQGKIEEARTLAAVSGGPFPEEIPSYSGFFTVNKQYNSNLYFWFFPAENDYENAPVLLWLQGGPGSSSLYGLFNELGPFTVNYDDVSLVKNPYSWHKNHSIIFIDNPVGTGFSFTDFDEGYATNQTQVGNELYSAMTQFFTLFPELQKNDFFITGESFAGKYVPALGYTIHTKNPTADLKINLKGISVGNGFTDPDTIFNYSQFIFQLGLIDTRIRTQMEALEDAARNNIRNGQYVEAWQMWSEILGLWSQYSQYTNNFNFLFQNEPPPLGNYWNFVQSAEVRKLLHVGNTEYTSDGPVYSKMVPEFMLTVKPWLQVLMDNYRVLYYNGQMDVIVAYPLSVGMYETLEWRGREEYLSAERLAWYVGNIDLAGYMRTGGNFTEVLVRNAGHMVPNDQAVWALDLITKFTFDKMPK